MDNNCVGLYLYQGDKLIGVIPNDNFSVPVSIGYEGKGKRWRMKKRARALGTRMPKSFSCEIKLK